MPEAVANPMRALSAILLVLPLLPGAAELPADRIVIHKAKRELILLRAGKPIRTYRVALGTNPVGAKTRQGDRRTPEGIYTISGRNARSAYHRSLRVSYPNAEDRARAKKLGVDPGGDIMVHGLPNGQGLIGAAHRLADWTWGCIAVTNEEIEDIWRRVPNGTVVEILP
jgi:murein L,D-transpeptidase YafK